MKKLAVVVMMPALVIFMAATASAGGHHWGYIQGTYEMVATGSCIHSTEGFSFSGSGTPLEPTIATPLGSYFTSAYVGQGTWTFEGDGTGTMQVTQSCILPDRATQAVVPPDSSPPTAFRYRFEEDGTIIVTIPAFFLELSGRISSDHKTMTLVSAMQNQPLGPTKHQICDIARVLIRVSGDHDE
jgi:hypothetical protein